MSLGKKKKDFRIIATVHCFFFLRGQWGWKGELCGPGPVRTGAPSQGPRPGPGRPLRSIARPRTGTRPCRFSDAPRERFPRAFAGERTCPYAGEPARQRRSVRCDSDSDEQPGVLAFATLSPRKGNPTEHPNHGTSLGLEDTVCF